MAALPSAPPRVGELFAHGLGGGGDLPIPPQLAIAGGAAALTVSFTVLLIAWRRPRYTDPDAGLRAPSWSSRVIDHPALALALRVLGMAAFAYSVWAAVFGHDLLINPVFGIGYVWLWVGIVPASLLLGPIFRAISPARTIHLVLTRLTGGDPDEGVATYSARWGYWPAAIGLFTFVWLELVYPFSTELGPFRLWFAIYIAVMIVGATIFGSTWLERADPFEVYSTLVGHLSIWGRTTAGALVVRSPLRNLATIKGEAGLVAVVAVLLGSTAYDSFRGANVWLRFTQSFTGPITLVNTLALLAALSIVGLTFAAATMATGTDTRGTPRRALPREFAHSVVPIVVGYMVAHYLTFFVEYGQQTLIQASDPLSNGADLFGTGDWQVSYWLSYNPTLLASIKVLAIVTGHVLGVIAAHDKAIHILPSRHHVTGQVPLLCAMVLYTFAGLYLLFGS